jgi:hypothetical protein
VLDELAAKITGEQGKSDGSDAFRRPSIGDEQEVDDGESVHP